VKERADPLWGAPAGSGVTSAAGAGAARASLIADRRLMPLHSQLYRSGA
jgi:hypothetical protein